MSCIQNQWIIFLSLVMTSLAVHAQTGFVSGTVLDGETQTPLPGVNILTDSVATGSTDQNGHYKIELTGGRHTLRFRYIGFSEQVKVVTVEAGKTKTLNINLHPQNIELDMAIVTAGRFEQRLSDVTVSMEVIQPEFIENTNTVNMADAISKQPGVDVIDGQPVIRGGSGYSYGAGSRVMVLLDGLPILTADVNEVKWNFLPVENIEQVEILKGASSALYGSSALNGVINLITAWPGEKPETRFTLYSGMYLKPKRKELAWWWDGNPVFGGGSFSTMHKLGNWDLVAGASVHDDPGYRYEDYEKRIRANIKLRHRPQHLKGLTYGISASAQSQNTSDFLLWVDADSGAFLQPYDAISPSKAFRFNADPWISYFDKHQNRHTLRTRYYKVYNRFKDNADKNNGSDLFYGEYQFYRNFHDRLDWTFGMSGAYGISNAQLYGDHNNSTFALFTQFDYKLSERLSASLGLRWEYYTLDRTDFESSPVARAGLNYQAADFTFLRASFGQGYRFPSIAEKYISTTVGSLNIFPNPGLQSEKGWSAEIGLKQGVQISNWKGFIDIAGFWTEYNDMIEFTFGVWTDNPNQIPTIDDIGFKSLNIGKARINGIDIGLSGSGKIGKIPLTLFAGYTYMNPLDLSTDTLENDILKYRYRHSVKGDVEIRYSQWTAGATFSYNSFMERIDEAFEATIFGREIFPGLKEYRQENDRGSPVLDFRIGYELMTNLTLRLLINNLLNEEYMGRPGDLRPSRTIVFQATLGL